MATLLYSCRFFPKFHIPSCTQRLKLHQLLLMIFGCFRSCCCTLLCGHSWEEQEIPPRLDGFGGGRAGVALGGSLWSSQQQERDLSCHITKSSSCVSHQAVALSLSHVHVAPSQPFFIVCCILNLPFAGFLPD